MRRAAASLARLWRWKEVEAGFLLLEKACLVAVPTGVPCFFAWDWEWGCF